MTLCPLTKSIMLSRQRTVDSSINLEETVEENCKKEEAKVEEVPRENGGGLDWGPNASATTHIFVTASGGAEVCYVGSDCGKDGVRLKCVACKVVAHVACKNEVLEILPCKRTFYEGVRTYRENMGVEHHWVARKQIKGKCRQCNKTFQSKLGNKFSPTTAGVSCSWCRLSYHSSVACQEALKADQVCGLGIHSGLIVPPSWILKLPRKGFVESSLKFPIKEEESAPQVGNFSAFVLKPIPISNCSPLIVFLNPKSGGNQGAKLMQRFQSLLNPRQVFDLTQGGPGPAIELFKNVPEVRLLACGGDGTAGWVLSVLDKIEIESPPPVGVLPLGTGNDLSRSLGWGGGYMDEPLSDILLGIQSADVISMDRWRLKTTPSTEHRPSGKGVDYPPLDVVNNYFSMGVDAQIALQFHEAREANPEKFNSRVRNKMYYTQAGGVDLLKAKWRKLSDYISIECDGKDITPKLKQHKVHSVLFLNISCFGSGTRPWNTSSGAQRLDDGLIEVIGLTTYQLPLLQAGGTGHCITQCKEATITTTKTIPVQVDGEAVRLNPCTIELSHLNKAKILAKKKSGRKICNYENDEQEIPVEVSVVSMTAYEEDKGDKAKLMDKSIKIGTIILNRASDLRHVRLKVNKLTEDITNGNVERRIRLGTDWTYIDCRTAKNCFRVEKVQEKQYFLIDICTNHLLLLENTKSSQIKENGELDMESVKRSSGDNENDNIHNGNGIDITPGQGVEEERHPTYHIAIPVFKETDGLLEKNTEAVLKAARMGDLKMITDLFNEGYSLLAIDETAKTALHYAARFGNKDIVKFLLQKAPQSILDIMDNEKGQTALHKAAAYKRLSICCLLVTAGASLLVRDNEGRTPRQLALTAGAEEDMVAYLESQEHFQNIALQDMETPI